MSGQMMNYNKYYKSLEMMPKPIKVNELPKAKIECKKMFAYAEENGKRVSDLTREEQSLFIKRY